MAKLIPPVNIEDIPVNSERDVGRSLIERLDMSQITVLSPQRHQNTGISKLDSINKLTLSDDMDSWRAGRSILVTTIRAFKGLEVDVVLLLLKGPTASDSLFTQADYYVACSRAKHLLIIFSEQALE